MTASDSLAGEQLGDAVCVFGVQSAIRDALDELAANPLCPKAGARVRYLLEEPASRARAALSRMQTDRRHEAGRPVLRLVCPRPGAEIGA